MATRGEIRALVVEIGDVECGIPADEVVELHRAVRHTRLPGAPAVVEGVVNIRGTVVPVIDMRLRFGLRTRPVEPSDRLVVVNVSDRMVALRVDRVMELVVVPGEEVEVAAAVSIAPATYTRGIAKTASGLTVICDLPAFLSAEELVALDAAACADEPGERL